MNESKAMNILGLRDIIFREYECDSIERENYVIEFNNLIKINFYYTKPTNKLELISINEESFDLNFNLNNQIEKDLLKTILLNDFDLCLSPEEHFQENSYLEVLFKNGQDYDLVYLCIDKKELRILSPFSLGEEESYDDVEKYYGVCTSGVAVPLDSLFSMDLLTFSSNSKNEEYGHLMITSENGPLLFRNIMNGADELENLMVIKANIEIAKYNQSQEI